MDSSPCFTVGALIVANTPVEERGKVLRQLTPRSRGPEHEAAS
ncbi:hypothetical protein [Arthrobacter sp. CAN_C5]|nr:hypothetical protein [Arthrobacter sp. CAN_C5]MBP2214958.1 hypothetical protein [Arthrobacter sp. CAN_C5]